MKTFYTLFFALGVAFAGHLATAQPGAGKPHPSVAAETAATSLPVAVPARKAGRVWEVYVKEGQHVRQGQTLFKIATQTRTNAHPGHQIDYEIARQQYIKVLALHKAGKTSPEEVAAAKFQVQMASKLLNDAPQEVLFHYVDAPVSGTLSKVNRENQLQATSVLAVITADPAPKSRLVVANK